MVASVQANHGRIFRIPLGDFGFFASLLLSFSLGFLAFFATCFIAIFGILIYNGAGHHVNFADSYRYIALPVGLIVLAVSFVVLLGFWLRRKLSGN
jgi:ABC-type dipeptide/oligopeptide/nickel transport system permease subunit